MKLGLIIVFLIFFITALITVYATKGIIFKYIARFRSDGTIFFLTRLHLILALILAFFLPNNFLQKFDVINNLFKENGILIPVSMLLVFIMGLVLIGVIFNLIFKTLGFNAQNNEAFSGFMKKYFDFK